MLSVFYPSAYAEDVFSIDYQMLLAKGYRAVVFDIDNTLVPHGADSNPDIDQLFQNLNDMGLQTCLLSNNDQARVDRFCRNINTLYVCDADKPGTDGIRRAQALLAVEKDKIVMVGDQVFTDILCANRYGIASILVKFIGYYTEKNIGIRRTIEKGILKAYRHSGKYQALLGDAVRINSD